MDGLDIDRFIHDLAAANEAESLARSLDRRGGGFTSHASAVLRERAERTVDDLQRRFDGAERSG